ncbi:hypothetical protein ABXJ76_05600 [Methylobacter sp. G7]|uniref:hypothetical protein n=1 Tax=Methylobacter sp. G7 TaxID=3230117 RepID=UPI003D802FA2
MTAPFKLNTQQIGKLGELLVQYRLLLIGVESAHLTTDAGIDLVAYSQGKKEAITIQVKTNLQPKPGGGKGKLALDWWVPDNSPAELFALVDISENRIWVFTRAEMKEKAQQQPEGRLHFYIHTDPSIKRHKDASAASLQEFEEFLLENRIGALF